MYRTTHNAMPGAGFVALVCCVLLSAGCQPRGQAAADEGSAQPAVEQAESVATQEQPVEQANSDETTAQPATAETEVPGAAETEVPGAGETEIAQAAIATESSHEERILNPDVDAATVADVVTGNTAFGVDLYRALRAEQGNLFFSPYSISVALAMTYAGARENTEAQMSSTLHFPPEQSRLHAAFNALQLALASRGEAAEGEPTDEGDRFKLNIVNAVWAQQGFTFLPEFLSVLSQDYGAEINLVDFVGATEAARVRINQWVSDQTEGKIEELIAEGVLTALTRMVLTNAIYFSASWADAFDVEATQDAPFHLLDGSEVTVPMMAKTAQYGYLDGEGFVAVEMPYYGGDLSMVVLLPDEAHFEEFENRLTTERLAEWLTTMSHQRVALKLPRFTFSYGLDLVQTLTGMGMPDAFDRDLADFSGMTTGRDLYISAVIHQAFVSVDESGTEAAAATAVVMALRSASIPREPPEVVVDRPFLFLIRDIESGTILFMGRVLNPTT